MSFNEQAFQGVTFFILTTNETQLLRNTVSVIRNTCADDDIAKIVIVAKNNTCDGYREAKAITQEQKDGKTEAYVQKSDTLELCLAELPPMVQSSHFLIMAADMEMRPDDVHILIEHAKKHPQRIICASKWHKDSKVSGYGHLHALGSRTINTFISILFQKKIKDPFSIYQIFPICVYNKCNFNNPSTFAYEYTLKPIRYGFEYEEIPTVYEKRKQGKTNFSFCRRADTALTFCSTAIKVRFTAIPKNNT